MADNERSPSDPHAGLPRVSPEDIKTFKESSRNLRADFERLKEDNPTLAHELTISSIGPGPDYLREKRAFAAGALFVYFLLSDTLQVRELEGELHRLLPNDDGGDEDQPLSA